MQIKEFLFGKTPRVFKVRFGIGSGLYLYLDPRGNTQRILGLAEAEVAGCFRDSARQCERYIELGASDGYYCAIVRRHNPNARIVAFEPQRHFAAIARANFERNGLSTENFEWRAEYGGTEGNPLGSLLGGDAATFIKIDIDGGESVALQSMNRELGNFRGSLLIEVHSAQLKSECLEALGAQGFACKCIKQAWWRYFVPERRPLELNEWIIARKGPTAR